MKSLYQSEIIKLEDKDLQLRYILGGMVTSDKTCNCGTYWSCDIRCSTTPVEEDEKFKKVKDFINRHNISNETFLRLALTYLRGNFHSFKGDFGTLIPELDRALLDYEFNHYNGKTIENDLKEKELLELVDKVNGSNKTSVSAFLVKYSLTPIDFIILAKTSLNYQYSVGRGFEIKDLPSDLKLILKENNLNQSLQFVKQYQQEYAEKEKNKNIKEVETIEVIEEEKNNEKGIKSLVKRFRNRFKDK